MRFRAFLFARKACKANIQIIMSHDIAALSNSIPKAL